MIEVERLTVRFGGVASLSDVTMSFSAGTNGLIGPNGAGKTTFFNVLSGFVKPHEGRVAAFGDDVLAITPFRRPRWGLRRTFQTEQAITTLSVYENVLVVLEHSGSQGRNLAAEAKEAAEFAGLGNRLHDLVGGLGAGERRLVEIARAVAGSPRLVLLDEPAAGLPEEETADLVSVLQRISSEIDTQVIIVDHDMSLVQACCEHTAVLDFGRLIAAGPTEEVLRDVNVVRAYLGDDEEIEA